ncbi:MAG: IS110 family transposase [Thermoanaerobaculia bacterium]|nr:IS110 family transposase [Thermoanaerobaculia bacterium]
MDSARPSRPRRRAAPRDPSHSTRRGSTSVQIYALLRDRQHFASPRALMAYLGLVPSEDSSGDRHRRGRITKTGNGLVRRVLVEAAWHYQHRAGVGPALAARRVGQPPRVIAIADKAQQRLCRRFRRLTAEHKPAPKVVVAAARELVGFIWAALQPATAA